MRAPITDKHLLEMMWERFPEIMKRGIEQPAPVAEPRKQEPVAWVFRPHKELLWPYEIERQNPIELDSYAPLYTRQQMREYAKKAVEAEREANAQLAERTPKIAAYGAGLAVQDHIASAIRARASD